MSDKKTTTYSLKSNFAFAIIAILSVGLLLYTTIEVYNCKQDINQINNEIQKLSIVGKVKSDNDTVKLNDEKIEDIDLEKISYNEDGSIDTSNWKTYVNKEYGFSVKYPEKTCIFKLIMNPDEHDDISPSCKRVSTKIITKEFKTDIVEPKNVFSVSFGTGIPNQGVEFFVKVFPKTDDEYYKLKFQQFEDKNIIYEVKNIEVDGLSAKKVAVLLKNKPNYYHNVSIFIEKDNWIYRIGNDASSKKNSFDGWYDKIINNFKFIE